MTKPELIAARKAAGAAYAQAAAAYVDAWITLKAYDTAYGNGNLGLTGHAASFPGVIEVMPHAEFLREHHAVHARAVDRAHEKHVAILATIAD